MEDEETDYSRYIISPTFTLLLPELSHAVGLNGIISRIDDRDNFYDDEDADLIGGGLTYLAMFGNKVSLKISIEYQNVSYDAEVVDYESDADEAHKDRRDELIAAALDLEIPVYKQVGFFAGYTYIHSSSNVEVYEYDRNLIESGVTIRF